MLLRFVPPRPRGIWDVSHAVLAGGVGVAVLAGSVWMVYELEILKARHFSLRRLRRQAPPEEGSEAAVEELLEARGVGEAALPER
jgi:hypothetical protein